VAVAVSSIIETDIEIQTENLSCKTRRFARSAWISQIEQPTDSAEQPVLNRFKAVGTFSSGSVESFNNKVKLVTRKSYGFKTQKA